ncbi:MAG: hypothetical protein E6G86_15300 [Alphaproteobacteria bacterium]|nr:MAG: hypothetical protein E6G86_15300 [Alphaproteobacteria bacterium]
MTEEDRRWPALPLEAWEPTRATLHMWTQIVGKVRLALSPYMNHWWQVPLYVTARGLTTSPIPYDGETFEILFDFIEHDLLIQKANGTAKTLRLAPRSVAEFYADVMAALRSMDIAVKIWTMPVEIPNPIPFDEDRTHAAYDPDYANRFWRILVSADAILKEFRGRFIGKASPVHFFWGSFDLAVTRFSGRRAPEIPGADLITREGYSHEVSSVGWWPGDELVKDPAFYSYAAPQPSGFPKAPVRPAAASYNTDLSQFLLSYDDVREAASPRQALLEFCQSTYEAAATLGKWNRADLEHNGGHSPAGL